MKIEMYFVEKEARRKGYHICDIDYNMANKAYRLALEIISKFNYKSNGDMFNPILTAEDGELKLTLTDKVFRVEKGKMENEVYFEDPLTETVLQHMKTVLEKGV